MCQCYVEGRGHEGKLCCEAVFPGLIYIPHPSLSCSGLSLPSLTPPPLFPPPPLPPLCPSLSLQIVGRRRRWFSVADAIAQTARRPQKQRYLIAACDLAQLQRNPTTLRSHSGPLKQLPSPSTCYHRTPVLLLILTCALVFCVGVYMIVY